MKKLTFYIYFMCLATMLSGQVYHPLIRSNTYWDVAYTVSPAPCYMYVGRTEFIQGDSLIDGHYYRFQNEYPFLGTPGPGGSICAPYVVDTIPYRRAFLREDTLARKVFIYDVNYEPQEQLLYDFSLSPGDTFHSAYATQGGLYVVYSVSDIILLNGEIRKIFCFDANCILNYIESIGGCQGLYDPIVIGYGFNSGIICVKDNGISIWGGSCFYQFVSTPEFSKPHIHIGPNPAADKLTVEFPFNPMEMEIKLINFCGQQCAKIVLPPGKEKAEMDVSPFPAGIYLVRVTDGNRIAATEKVVLK